MLHQYSRQQSIDVIQNATFTELKYWDKIHGILLEVERKQSGR